MIPTVTRRRSTVRPRQPGTTVVLARGDAELASWPLGRSGRPDLSVVEELARLQLAARRRGCVIRLRHACPALSELLDLVGLGEIVTGGARLWTETGGEAEGGEQVGVEEVVMPDDPVP